MALQCDVTRIISYMLEDERSEFTYDNVKKRTLTATASTESSGDCGNDHGSQHGDQNEFGTISWWNVRRSQI